MKYTLDYLLTLLQGDDGKYRNKYIDLVPNVKSFKVVIQGKNIPLEKKGISKSVKSHIEFEFGPNKKINRYIQHQIIRLQKYSKLRDKRFWTVAESLLKGSVCWFVIHLNRVFPRWYRNMPVWVVLRLRKEMAKIVKDPKGDIDFKRAYIPKVTTTLLEWAEQEESQKRWRPLGVPSPAWRVYLSALNTILILWLEPYWQEQQHGYFPRKGTLTAWREIMKRINEPNIYEFDLKQFFPSVEIQYVSKMLEWMRTPKRWVVYIENLNKSKPKLMRSKEEDPVDESRTREALDLEKGILNRDQLWYQPVRLFIKDNGIELWRELVTQDTGGWSLHHEYEMVQLQWALLSSFKGNQTFHSVLQGLPQGGGISPTLSVQNLYPLFRDEENVVMYADDGIIFGHPKFNSPEYQEAGIILNEKKSSWVKKDGVWLKPLKFCGIVYDWKTNTWTSRTAKGKTLTVKQKQFNALKNATEMFNSEGPSRKINTWYSLLLSRVSGFVQACMYNGTWDLSETWNKWDLTKTKTSWLNSKASRRVNLKLGLYNASTYATRWYINRVTTAKRQRMGSKKK
jgi:hypothetical protein